MNELTEQQKVHQSIIDWQTAFGSDSGLRVLDRLSKFCLEKQSTYTPNNQYETAFNEGARSVILYINRMLERNPQTETQLDTLNQKEE
jgi:hypothetical protein